MVSGYILGMDKITRDLLSKAILSKYNSTNPLSQIPTGKDRQVDSNQVMSQAIKNSTVDLSAFSRQINTISHSLKGDKEALDGLRNFVKEFGQSSDKTEAIKQISALNKMETTDKGTLKSVFQAAEDISKMGGSVSRFVGTVSGMSGAENRQAFVSQVQDIATDTKSSILDRRTTLNDLYATTSAAIKKAGKDEGKQQESLNTLYSGLDKATTLQDKTTFMKEFRSDLQNTA